MGRCSVIRALAVLSALSAAACSPPAPTYAVNLSPTWTAGQKFAYIGEYTTSTRAKRVISGSKLVAEESVEQKQSKTLRLVADGEALEIFPDGQLKKLVLTVKTLDAKSDDKPLTGLPTPGTKIIIEKTPAGQRNVSFQGGSDGWTPPANGNFGFDLLNPALWIEDSKYTMQEEFGPSGPVAVGATWTGNSTAILDDARDAYEHVTDATATMMLDSADGTGNDQTFGVSGSIILQGVKSPLPAAFAGPVNYSSKLLLTLPATTIHGVLIKKQTVNMDIRGETTDPASGAKVTVTINADRAETHKITFQ